MVNEIIQKVWANSATGQKHITIPKDANIGVGDFVKVVKVNMVAEGVGEAQRRIKKERRLS